MSDLISREYMKSLGATCIASRSKDGNMFPIVSIDELPPADPTHPTPSNTLGALDCVSREDLTKGIEAYFDDLPIAVHYDMLALAQKLPSAQPDKDLIHLQKEQSYMQGYEDGRKPRKGKWTRHFDGNEWYWYCSSCKEQWYEEDLWMGGNSFPNFCPNCGADMREGGEDRQKKKI